MSDSIEPGRGGKGSTASAGPRAVVHKKILEAAEARPDASYDELADAVSGASTDLVERVIDEYGDPAENGEGGDADDDQNTPTEPSADTDETMSTPDAHDSDDTDPDLDQLTDRQERVLRAVRDRPNATQEEIAAQFDVSAATISQRVNAIDGFDWPYRRGFVESLFEDEGEFEADAEPQSPGSEAESDDPTPGSETRPASGDGATDPETPDPEPAAPDPEADAPGPDSGGANPVPDDDSGPDAAEPRSGTAGSDPAASHAGTDTPGPESAGSGAPSNGEQPAGTEAVDRLSGRVGDLTERVAALEGRIEERSPAEGSFSDPDLVSKMVHACMESERVSEEEELRILRQVLTTGRPADS